MAVSGALAVVLTGGMRGQGMTVAEGTVRPWPRMIEVLVALSILQLHERRLVDIEDPVHRHLEVWRDRSDSWPVRIRHLLADTAGLWNGTDPRVEWAPAGGGPWLLETFSPALREHGLPRWRPGERQQQSALGTLALAVIVEERTGRRFHQYVHENIFAPLGMDTARLVASGAEGSIDDLGRLAAALADDPAGAGTVLGDEAARQLFAQQLRFDGLAWPRGLHWRHDRWRGEPCVVHRGDDDGNRVYLRICRATKAWVVALGDVSMPRLVQWSDDALREQLTKAP